VDYPQTDAEIVAYLDRLTDEERQALAGPWPVRWLYPPKKGDRPRALNFCGGCGGGCTGLRTVLGQDFDAVCVEWNKDAAATSALAGCTVLCEDVKKLEPTNPSLRWTSKTMFTMPCPDWCPSGKHAGHDPKNLEVLIDAIDRVGAAYGNYWIDGSEVCEHDDSADCDEMCWDRMGEPSGETAAELWQLVDAMTAKTAGLMLAPVIWVLGLRSIGAPLDMIVIEQSGALPEALKDEIQLEFSFAGCEYVEWETLDAKDFGSASARKRSIMMANWYRRPGSVDVPQIATNAAAALGWPAKSRINTRGRHTSGGNVFSMDRTITCVTSKIRGWYDEETGRRFAIPEVCALVAMPGDYPVQGSRTSQCQQLGDIFSPLVAAAVWGTLLGVPWLPLLKRYLAAIYPHVHGAWREPAELAVRAPAMVLPAQRHQAPKKPRRIPGLLGRGANHLACARCTDTITQARYRTDPHGVLCGLCAMYALDADLRKIRDAALLLEQQEGHRAVTPAQLALF